MEVAADTESQLTTAPADSLKELRRMKDKIKSVKAKPASTVSPLISHNIIAMAVVVWFVITFGGLFIMFRWQHVQEASVNVSNDPLSKLERFIERDTAADSLQHREEKEKVHVKAFDSVKDKKKGKGDKAKNLEPIKLSTKSLKRKSAKEEEERVIKVEEEKAEEDDDNDDDKKEEEDKEQVSEEETQAEIEEKPVEAVEREDVAEEKKVRQLVPNPPLKFKDSMALHAIKQREYLQGMHLDPPPSDKAAKAFIKKAKESIKQGIQPGDPPIWPHPGDGRGSPGDNKKYTIAGKKVTVPYGYPEETIFILSASYRDPEAAATVARAYARAAHPERIFVGIHAQNEGGELEPERDPIAGLGHIKLSCPQHPICSRLDQVRVSRSHYLNAEGPMVARSIAERLYRNETYVMGVDSHTHFLRGWDNVAIDMFKRIGNDHAIITTYPPDYTPDLQRGDGSDSYDINPLPKLSRTICRTRKVKFHKTIQFKHDFNTIERPKDGPIRVAFLAAGFGFSRGHRILRVPYDYRAAYVFDGEETSMGVRAWTWGYDLYQPDRDVTSHLYIPAGSPLRPAFWTTEWDYRWPLQYRSVLRINAFLHIHEDLTPDEPLDVVDLLEEDKYGTGPRRDPKDFWKWAGIPMRNEYGEICLDPNGSGKKGKEYCYSLPMCPKYRKPGGMPYVPWKEGTEGLFPPMVRTDKYPPDDSQLWIGN